MLYDKLKQKENQIKELTNLGLINPVWLRNIEIYEMYQKEIEEGNKIYESYHIVSLKAKPAISWQSVRKIVNDLSN